MLEVVQYLTWCVCEGKAGAGQQVKQSPEAGAAQPVTAAAHKTAMPGKKRAMAEVSKHPRYHCSPTAHVLLASPALPTPAMPCRCLLLLTHHLCLA